MSRRNKWLTAIGVTAVTLAGAGYIAGSMMIRRFEPYVRQQAIQYLSDRFDSDVDLGALRVSMRGKSVWRALRTKGRGVIAQVEAESVSLRRKNVPADTPPLLKIGKFRFDADLGELWEPQKKIKLVSLDGLEINIPPKGQRPKFSSSSPSTAQQPAAKNPVIIEQVQIRHAKLVILSKHRDKPPLQFDIHRLDLKSAGIGMAMKYDAVLTNAKPPGEITSHGSFGPWDRDEPGDTELAGDYTFDHANLGVFSGIAGTLDSTGRFEGSLSAITATGDANVPDFRLKMAGNPVPLSTHFEVLVDGTNGNTILKPVTARLGNTRFVTSGAVIKHEGDRARTIKLDVAMVKGNLPDLLRLAMKGAPFMEGKVALKTKIEIPPLSGDVAEKLRLNGSFDVSDAKFLKSNIQDQIDTLSRKGQGQPKNAEIDEVVSHLYGSFRLENQVISFTKFSFGVPGALVDLAGNYDMDNDTVDFHGSLKLQAKVSQTQTGWKRWALKPVDPFFAKNGAGTYLRIVVDGAARKPSFRMDRGHKTQAEKVSAAAY